MCSCSVLVDDCPPGIFRVAANLPVQLWRNANLVLSASLFFLKQLGFKQVGDILILKRNAQVTVTQYRMHYF